MGLSVSLRTTSWLRISAMPTMPSAREFFCYEGADEGTGYLISTYQGDGDPLPSFVGEPVEVSLPTANELWVALNADNKVSLYANVGGTVKLYNKNLGD